MKKSRKVKISTLGSQVTSAISVAMVLTLLGLMAMAMMTSSRLADDIRSNIGIVVKMLPGASDDDVMRVEQGLRARPGVVGADYSSPEAILAEEAALMGDDPAGILDENPFGGEFAVKLSPAYANSDSISRLAALITNDTAVDEIVSESEVVDSINSLLSRVSMVLLAAAAILLIISFVLINNTVSLAVYSRRFIIHTMKLVGATGGFIRRPFLLAGAATGAVSALIAIGAVAGLRVWAATFDPMVDELLTWPLMAWVFAGMLLAGPAICLTAAAMATNRYLRASYDDMFR